jgi:SAM-dependent methyltransferase
MFSANVPPGSVALQKMNVCAPLTSGNYILEFNLVHELVTWFDAGYRLPVKVSETAPHNYPEAKRSWLDHSALYGSGFFEEQARGSRSSAHAVLDFVLSLPIGKISTALDVGCGVGTWVAELCDRGIDAIGVDGDYVDTRLLQIPQERFAAYDLRNPLDFGRQFDLVISVEVIEHIEPFYETQFVESLTRHADLVLFSGAIPGQGGAHHVNERWPSHWTALFAEQGYELFDIVRPALWADRSIEWWYRQNILLFAKGIMCTALSSVQLPHMPVRDVVHPEHRLIISCR